MLSTLSVASTAFFYVYIPFKIGQVLYSTANDIYNSTKFVVEKTTLIYNFVTTTHNTLTKYFIESLPQNCEIELMNIKQKEKNQSDSEVSASGLPCHANQINTTD